MFLWICVLFVQFVLNVYIPFWVCLPQSNNVSLTLISSNLRTEFRRITRERNVAILFPLRSSFSFPPRFVKDKQYDVEPRFGVDRWGFTRFLARAVCCVCGG